MFIIAKILRCRSCTYFLPTGYAITYVGDFLPVIRSARFESQPPTKLNMPITMTLPKQTWLTFVLLLCSLAHQAAFGVTQYLLPYPLIDNDIEHLVVVADLPAMSKPYPVALIKAGLVNIEGSHPGLYQRINRYLIKYIYKRN